MINSDSIYFIGFISLIFFIVSLINIYKYFKMNNNYNNYIEVKGKVIYVNTILSRHRYKTFCTYNYFYQGNTYEAYDRGYGKNLKKLNEEVSILINPNNPKKYLPPMKYNDKNRYLLFGIIYLVLGIFIIIRLFK